jgi:predicted GNAT family acetyltransferase
MSAALTIVRYAEPERFLEAAQGFLRAAEVENNLLLGIALNARARESPGAPPYWLTVRTGADIVGCACRTPPHPLVLARAPVQAIAVLAAELRVADPTLPGVTGPTAEAEAFAEDWVAHLGGRWTARIRLRLHELTRLAPPADAPAGTLRKAAEADVALARQWIDAYVHDTGMHPPAGDMAQRLVDRGQLFLWVDDEGEPRSMVAATRDSGSGCSINTVYTPPRFRRSGYATAAVATLSRHLLEAGRRFCCLYTDAANPTSNSIYAKIGFRPIRDDVEIAFER